MAYQLGTGIWTNIFAVPCDIVDRHIKLCSPLSLKVLMVLLRHGGDLSLDGLAKALGQSRADVQDALNYWIANGVLAEQTGEAASSGEASSSVERPALSAPPALTYTIVEDPAPAPVAEQPEPRKIVALSKARSRLTTQEINEMADQDHAIGNLLQETQQVLGKPLTPVMTDLVVALYSYYGMKPDMVLMLVQYCRSIGKESVNYMEKVAAGWLEQGIDSHEKAEAEILRATQKLQAEYKIKAAFGIHDRTLITSEKNYIKTWFEEYGMELPIIQLAFERSVEIKGKLSFAYINGILANWHQKGLRTPAEAMREMNRAKEQHKEKKADAKASYDMDELENLISHGDL